MLELTIESVLKSLVSTYFLGLSPSMEMNPALICWLSGIRFPPSVSSTVVQLPSASTASTAPIRFRIAEGRKLLNRFIESVVIIEKVVGFRVLVFEDGFFGFPGPLDDLWVDIRGCGNHSVGIMHNESAEIFV